MKSKYFLMLLLVPFSLFSVYYLVWVYIGYRMKESQERTFQSWKEKEFVQSYYYGEVFLLREEGGLVSAELEDIHTKEQVLDFGGCCFFPGTITEGDTICKEKNSYTMYILRNGKKEKLDYKFWSRLGVL